VVSTGGTHGSPAAIPDASIAASLTWGTPAQELISAHINRQKTSRLIRFRSLGKVDLSDSSPGVVYWPSA
jgi:hypothetical protein